MKKSLLIFSVVVLTVLFTLAVSTAGAEGDGELMASFQAGLSGGAAIVENNGAAASVASPKTYPEGRIEPFSGTQLVCDQLTVGTWVFWLDDNRGSLDALTNEFKLDGDVLDTTRTPLKRISRGPFRGWWWFGEGVPVLGVLDPGQHDIEWSFDDGSGPIGPINTLVDVDSANC